MRNVTVSLTVTNSSSYADNVSHVNYLTLSTLLTSPNATATAADPTASNQVSIADFGIALAPVVVCTTSH
jgi:hypothetical protein